ncbi:MAG TPA: response regulator [Sedimenticola thiotaurini]|uniref:Response regulator n=1 Tax=Sedimenticola thiotaurini TaxID=1543721 RepID=A0A831RQU3_9GAMM|nr:response regulator [Sedimenticola thiotaurini]
MDSERTTILVVDDEPFYLEMLTELLSDDYSLLVAKNGEQALRRARGRTRPNLILLDITMPVMGGFEVCRRLKNNTLTRQIPVIFLTARNDVQDEIRGLELGAVDYVSKPINGQLLKRRVATHLSLAERHFALERLVQERTRELQQTKDALVFSMGAMAEMRDRETGNHLLRTEHYVRILAESLAEISEYGSLLDRTTIDLIRRAAPLHDIGKIGVPDRILQKKGPLTEEEQAEMRNHVLYGERLLDDAAGYLGETPFIHAARDIAGNHHERWDGSGYPRGRKGEEIPLSARLMALADVYDALTSRRCYKEPITHEDAVRMILQESGTHFDPQVVNSFERKQEKFLDIMNKHRD